MTATLHDVRPGALRRSAATALGVMAVLVVGVIGVVGLGSGTVGAQGLPLCGGNQTIRPAPRTCFNTKLIDGTEITVVLDVTASGVATATYTLGTPRPADTPIRMRWHEGISSGPLVDEISGVIPAGSLGPVTLQLQATRTCGGQIDTKAVFTGNGDGRGRVAAPYISLDICNQPTTTAATTTTAAYDHDHRVEHDDGLQHDHVGNDGARKLDFADDGGIERGPVQRARVTAEHGRRPLPDGAGRAGRAGGRCRHPGRHPPRARRGVDLTWPPAT